MLEILLPFYVIVPILIAVFLYVSFSLKIARWVAVGMQAAFTGFAFYLLLATQAGETLTRIGDYEGYLGIILRSDTLASVFVLLTAVIFLAVTVYNLRAPEEHTSRLYWFLLFLLEGTLIGLFLTRDFFNIFVLVEVSTVVVTILLMYDRKRRNLFAGMTFILVNIIVMQFYLFGVGYIYFLTGVLDMEAAAVLMADMDRADLVLPYALIMTGIAAKCSLLPLLVFMPKVNAFTGSRFTIAAIMSGLYIKSGIYLFIRIEPVFGGIGAEFFLAVGLVTAFAGVVLALAQKDVRLMLAYSTLAQVGLIIAGLNLGDDYSHMGAVFHILNHALLKAALFIGAGMIAYLYDTKDFTKIRGLMCVDPWLGAAHLPVVLGIMGAPLFNGFVSKYFLARGAGTAMEWLFIAVNLGTVLVFVRYSAIFFGRAQAQTREVDTDWCRHSVVLFVGFISVVLGIFGPAIMGFLFDRPVAIGIGGFFEKTAVFALSLGLAIGIYRKWLAKKQFLRPLMGLQISFKALCVSIGVFFGVLLLFVGIVP